MDEIVQLTARVAAGLLAGVYFAFAVGVMPPRSHFENTWVALNVARLLTGTASVVCLLLAGRG